MIPKPGIKKACITCAGSFFSQFVSREVCMSSLSYFISKMDSEVRLIHLSYRLSLIPLLALD